MVIITIVLEVQVYVSKIRQQWDTDVGKESVCLSPIAGIVMIEEKNIPENKMKV